MQLKVTADLKSTEFPTTVIKAVGVGVQLGGIPIVRGADLEIQAGETVAIMGNNGSGKTTFMRALLGLVPHSGKIELFGKPLGQFRDWVRIGYVPQRSGILVQQATCREVVASGRLAHRRPFWPESAADKTTIAAVLEKVGLANREQDRFVSLSGGQQQRVLIARALATGADLMVWDEPFAGVDHVTQEILADLVSQLSKAGTTTVIILHDSGPFARLIDRSILVRDGWVEAHEHDHTHDHGGHEAHELAPIRPHSTGLEAR